MITTFEVYVQISEYLIACHKMMVEKLKKMTEEAMVCKNPFRLYELLNEVDHLDKQHKLLEKYVDRVKVLLHM